MNPLSNIPKIVKQKWRLKIGGRWAQRKARGNPCGRSSWARRKLGHFGGIIFLSYSESNKSQLAALSTYKKTVTALSGYQSQLALPKDHF